MFASTCFRGIARAMPALPPPAPLPSLPTAFSRRAAIVGAVASTGALAGAAARALGPSGALPADDMPRLYAEARALRGALDRAGSEAELDRLDERVTDLERRAIAIRVNSSAGAVAALEWARSEVELFSEATRGDGFIVAMMDHALGVLRTAEA